MHLRSSRRGARILPTILAPSLATVEDRGWRPLGSLPRLVVLIMECGMNDWSAASDSPEVVEFGPVRGLGVTGVGQPGGRAVAWVSAPGLAELHTRPTR
jgi:hypothetical protein